MISVTNVKTNYPVVSQELQCTQDTNEWKVNVGLELATQSPTPQSSSSHSDTISHSCITLIIFLK